jgi:hypothetical protein
MGCIPITAEECEEGGFTSHAWSLSRIFSMNPSVDQTMRILIHTVRVQIFYSFAFGLLNAFASTAAHSRMTFRWIFPLGDLGTSSMNCSNNISQHENLTGPKTNRRKEHKHTLTPPVNCLCLATSFAVHAWISASFTLPFEASFSAT